MSIATPLSTTDGQPGDAAPNEPSMAEILASIRRIIADDQLLSESLAEARKDAPAGLHAADVEPGAPDSERGGKGRPLLSSGTENSVTAAFQTLLASRFARHGDAVIELTREMLRPMLKAWLDTNLPSMVERLVSAEIERLMRSD
jgi:cell pole-organizing protein PopZ